MHLPTVLLCLCLTTFAEASGGSEWCYHGCAQTPEHWADISGAHCGGGMQSPIDIVTSHVQTDPSLGSFTLTNFSSQSVLKSLTNSGHTVKCTLEENEVEVSGGGLNGTYSSLQFHFHWGSTEHHPGSEHTVDKHRYPMEMHVVSLKKGLTVDEAKADPEGFAVLGFFIDATDGAASQAWDDFTSYIMHITTIGSSVDISHNISISDLIGDVDLTKFYRYNGSLTTPTCDEAVVWTVFQEPIKVSRELIERLSNITLTNVYRPTQALNGRDVYASPAIEATPSPGHTWCYNDHCQYSPNLWHELSHSYCGGERQSPINIEKKRAVEESKLVDFTFTKFDDKHTMMHIINTGHTVSCVLKDGMVEVSEGGLGYIYSTLQFHFHWGDPSDDTKGSEHTVDSKRYPMEMHIVNMRKDLTLEEAVMSPTGLAVLGFFIEATDGDSKSGGSSESQTEAGSTSHSDAWSKLTSYLSSIKDISSQVEVTHEISIDDLLGDVDRTAYYRYNGSLTTPSCNEAVVWTIFKNPIKVDKNLMKMFPRHTGYNNVYRPRQFLHSREVYTTAASSVPVHITFLLLLTCLYTLYI